jgi:hypothetical protein
VYEPAVDDAFRYAARMFRRWVSICLLAGCSADGGVCTMHSDCAGDEVCRDGRCVAADDLDAGTMSGVDSGGGGGVDAGVDAGTDGSCGGGELPISLDPPNVLVVIDRSCSMRRTVTDGEFGTGPDDPNTRWNIAREAVRRMTERYRTRVRWGLMAYPDALEGCGQPPTALVPPGPGTTDAIYTTLQSNDVQPFHWCDMGDVQPHQTPTDEALEAALLLPELADAERDDFVLLITDGAATCGADDTTMTDIGARLVAAGIRTAVVGFGAETTSGTAATMLEALAVAGGLANAAGPPSYYLAGDAAALDLVLEAIVFPSIPCTFSLLETPPDPDAVRVLANDEELEEGVAWSYDEVANEVELLGATCEALRRGDITRLGVFYGCATPTCTPHDERCNGLDDDCDGEVDDDCLD